MRIFFAKFQLFSKNRHGFGFFRVLLRTLRNQNPMKRVFNLLLFVVIITLFSSLKVNGQDTLQIKRVRVSNSVILSRKTNKIIKAWPHWVKVSEGYIVRKRGFYYFNGQYWRAKIDENNNLLALAPASDKELMAADLKK